MLSTYYVYEHRRKDNGAVFYVGKGKKERAIRLTTRNPYWKNVVNKAGGVDVTFVIKDIDEELAYLVESEYIDVLKRRGVALTNLTAGGEGVSGLKFTDEHKQKLAASKIGKKRLAEVVAKMKVTKTGKNTGEANPFFGRKHTEETKQKLSKALSGRKLSDEEKAARTLAYRKAAKTSPRCRAVRCTDTGEVYFSIAEAARQLDLHRACITLVCNGKMHHTNGMKFEWSNT